MLTKEQRIVISVILGIFAVVVFVCLYGFTIGGEYFSIKYILYCLLTSLTMASIAFLFVFKREKFKALFGKEPFIIVCLILIVVQLLMYQPLNLLSSNDDGKEYEVEITDYFSSKLSSEVYFIDKDGIERSKDITFKYIVLDDGELYPQTRGKMIVKERTGGFNCKHFEIIEVTYMPE